MTKKEFLNIDSWEGLLGFCVENDLTVCENVICEEELNNMVLDMIQKEYMDDTSSAPDWRHLSRRLSKMDNELCTEFFSVTPYGYEPLNEEDLRYYKYDALEEAKLRGLIEEPESEEVFDPYKVFMESVGELSDIE